MATTTRFSSPYKSLTKRSRYVLVRGELGYLKAAPTLRLKNDAFIQIGSSRPIFNSSSFLPTNLRHLSHQKILPLSSDSIFRAVASVDQYPSFLPFAISSDVTLRDPRGWPKKARLKIGYEKFGLEENWESLVECDETQGVIEAKCGSIASGQSFSIEDDGIFEVLHTRWIIESLKRPKPTEETGKETSVRLDIEVKFRNIFYDQLFAQVEATVANSIITAFEKRAKDLEIEQNT